MGRTLYNEVCKCHWSKRNCQAMDNLGGSELSYVSRPRVWLGQHEGVGVIYGGFEGCLT